VTRPREDGAVTTAAKAQVAALEAELAATRERLGQALAHVRRSDQLRETFEVREAALERELQHRVRNMLVKIRTLVSRTMDPASSLEEAADHLRGRLDTLLRYNAEGIRCPNGTIDLETLVLDELLKFGASGERHVSVGGPAVSLAHDVAETIGMAVHELATNAIKFGALSDRAGQLAVSWQVSHEPAARVSIEWREAGVAIVSSAPLHSGFGREFIEQALPYQLDADTSFELRPGGLLCRISVLLEQARPAA
jgi:two-component sensor histidine kinase